MIWPKYCRAYKNHKTCRLHRRSQLQYASGSRFFGSVYSFRTEVRDLVAGVEHVNASFLAVSGIISLPIVLEARCEERCGQNEARAKRQTKIWNGKSIQSCHDERRHVQHTRSDAGKILPDMNSQPSPEIRFRQSMGSRATASAQATPASIPVQTVTCLKKYFPPRRERFGVRQM